MYVCAAKHLLQPYPVRLQPRLGSLPCERLLTSAHFSQRCRSKNLKFRHLFVQGDRILHRCPRLPAKNERIS